eukprot:6213705-Pleurochrysis_carterae.AAC.3
MKQIRGREEGKSKGRKRGGDSFVTRACTFRQDSFVTRACTSRQAALDECVHNVTTALSSNAQMLQNRFC